MIKYLKYILIICPVILSLILAVNIYTYTLNKNQNQSIIETANNYSEKIKENNNKKKELESNLTTLKEENKDKITEYERWIKWNKEIQEKIN